MQWPLALYYLAGTAAAAVLIGMIVRRIRNLHERIDELHAEIEARGGAPLDPWAALAEIHAERAREDEQRAKKGRRPSNRRP